jgi:hypothetical protein
MQANSSSIIEISSRVCASIFGAYLFVFGLTSLGIACGTLAGIDYHEMQLFFYLIAFLIYLAIFFSAYVVRSLKILWCVLAGGGISMSLIAWAISSQVFGA